MNTTELKDTFRLEVMDTEEPVLWSDGEIYQYEDDAQKMFCRLTFGLGDASSAITQLPVAVGGEWVNYSQLILNLKSAYLISTGAKVEVINLEDMDRLQIRFDGRKGPVKYLILGLEPGRARLYPVPNTADTVQLVVERLPLKAINDGDQKIEIAEQHHRALLMWMEKLAYGKQDAETMDKKKSMDSDAAFRSYCFAAKIERDRALQKVRTTAYGGI